MTPASPDAAHALALTYAPRHARRGVGVLFALDERLGRIVRAAREPLIGQMRLTWWYEALVALDRATPPAEPLLQELAETVVVQGVSGAELAVMIDAWELLPGDEPLGTDALIRFGEARGGVLFALAARLCGTPQSDPVAAAGAGWALADLARHVGDPQLAAAAGQLAEARLEEAARATWSREGRALGALAIIARRPDAGPALVPRLIWHRLTGR